MTARLRTIEGDRPVVEVTGPAGEVYRHGWHSFSPARWVRADAPVHPAGSPRLRLGSDDAVFAERPHPGGSGLCAVRSAGGGPVTLLGALDVGARVEWRDGALRGETAGAPIRWAVVTGEEGAAFAAYAEALGDALGRRPGRPPRLWMSWYSLYDDIDAARLRAVLSELGGLDLDAFVVDDGWERGIGDWRANDRFPDGMAAFAAEIRDAGLVPGLWLAPFIARPGTPILDDHPDWFVADPTATADGGGVPGLAVAAENWGGPYHGLDLTHPDAVAHVAETISGLVEAGYGLLKLDFLFGGAIPGVRHRPVERERAYRDGVRAIREAAGETTRLLACGAPIVASLGVFDAIRIGPDVAGWWENGLAADLHVASEPATRDAIATSANRLWLRPLIDLDPDVAYFRSRAQMLTRPQQRLLQDLCLVCDARATSDPPGWLDDDEYEALRRFLADRPAVRRTGRHSWEIDGRPVDLGPLATLPLP